MHHAQTVTRPQRDAEMSRDRLTDLREQIDAIDDALLDLVERRLAASREVAALKSASGDGNLWLRPRREQAVIARLCGRAAIAPPELIERLWREIMGYSLQAQVRTELVLHAAEPDRLKPSLRARFGSAVPIRTAASVAEALDAAIEAEAVAVVAVDGAPQWGRRLDPRLSIFDWIADESGELVAVAVGRIAPDELPERGDGESGEDVR